MDLNRRYTEKEIRRKRYSFTSKFPFIETSIYYRLPEHYAWYYIDEHDSYIVVKLGGHKRREEEMQRRAEQRGRSRMREIKEKYRHEGGTAEPVHRSLYKDMQNYKKMYIDDKEFSAIGYKALSKIYTVRYGSSVVSYTAEEMQAMYMKWLYANV